MSRLHAQMTSATLLGLAYSGGMDIGREVDKLIPKSKTCLHCGDEYFHKKKFCSAECCKQYKPEQS